MADTTPWHMGPLVCFDTETTGVDVETDRIVTVCVAHVEAGTDPVVRHWLLDPGVEIPDEAAAIHGITTEKARAEGESPAPVLDIVAEELVAAWIAGRPAIAMNCSFDLTILDRELARHELPTLGVRLGNRPMLMVDPLVIDRALDRYRPGKKRLEDLCRVYGVKLDDAHDAAADALAAARVAFRMAQRFPADVGVGLELLQEYQQAWHVEYAKNLQEYFDRIGKDAQVSTEWPMRAKVEIEPTKPVCSEEGCDGDVVARGLCRSHYSKAHNAGTLPPKQERPKTPLGERLRSHLEADGDCLIWTGWVEPNGYGKLTVDGTSKWVHRLAWEDEHGPIEDGLTVDHLCRRPLCCNTEHMELVTLEENVQRAADANRSDTCPQGHPFDDENTLRNGDSRRCATCHRERERARKKTPDSSAGEDGEAPLAEDPLPEEGDGSGAPAVEPIQPVAGEAATGVPSTSPAPENTDAGREAVETWSARATMVRGGELSDIDHPLFDWKAACGKAEIQPVAVLTHLIKDWPTNDLQARPNRLSDIDRKVATDPIFADMVRELIADLGKAVA